MRVSHAAAGRDAVFDDPNLVSCGGLAAAAHQWGANELDRSKTTLAGQPRGEGAPRVSCPPKTPGRPSPNSADREFGWCRFLRAWARTAHGGGDRGEQRQPGGPVEPAADDVGGPVHPEVEPGQADQDSECCRRCDGRTLGGRYKADGQHRDQTAGQASASGSGHRSRVRRQSSRPRRTRRTRRTGPVPSERRTDHGSPRHRPVSG